MKAKRKLVALLILFLLSISTTAQAQERRTIPVSVVDKDGKIVEGLTAANFRGKFRGKEVTIISANLPSKPLRIAILLDTSKSMKEGMGFISVRTLGAVAVRDAVRVLAHDYPIALFGFNKNLIKYTDFTQDLAQLSAGFERMTDPENMNTQGTNIYGSIGEAGRSIDDGDVGSVIYVVTDGHVALPGGKQRREIEQDLLRRGIRIYFNCIDLRHLMSQYPEITTIPVTVCETLSEATGGSYQGISFRAPKIQKRLELLVVKNGRTLFPKMVYIYRIAMELEEQLKKPRKWKLEVVDERGKKMKGVKIYYPRLLVTLEKEQNEK